MKIKKINNASEDEVEGIVTSLLDNAQHSVRYSTGLYHEFYDRPKVKEAFVNAAERVETFQLLLDRHADLQEKREQLPWLFALADKDVIDIRRASVDMSHWIITDDKNFRLEHKHPIDEPGTTNVLVTESDDTIKDLTSTIISTFKEEWESGQATSVED